MGAPRTAGPRVRELMAGPRVGRLGPGRTEPRTVSCSDSNAPLMHLTTRSTGGLKVITRLQDRSLQGFISELLMKKWLAECLWGHCIRQKDILK